jgi:phosphatidate cytidylyltransferase
MKWLNLEHEVQWLLALILAILVVAEIAVWLLRRARPDTDYTELVQRIRSWWVMFGVFVLAIGLSRTLAIVFFAFLSFLALKEYLSLIPTRRADRRVLFWAYLSIPAQYYWVYDAWYNMFLVFVPVWMFLLISARMVLIGETKDFLRAVGTLHWGLMTMVFAVSHLAYLLVLPTHKGFATAGPGLLVFLVFLTQFNDVAQYVWGKTLGRRKITPTVSPKKTAAGLIGGVLTTVLLSFVLAPFLTPLDRPHSIAVGLIIGVGGFLGDVTISALKRDLGVKDSGSLIPGHGGILDRIDSLTFTAPLFFHYMSYFYY